MNGVLYLVAVTIIVGTMLTWARQAGFHITPAEWWSAHKIRRRCPHPFWRCDVYKRRMRGLWTYCWECERWVGRGAGRTDTRQNAP